MSMKVAVYGSLKKGRGNHRLLEDSTYIGATRTAPEWTMYSMYAFPGIVPDGDTPILIEVYDVGEHTFSRLDMLEGYPSFYNRRQIDTEFGEAWIYYLNECDSGEIVETGVW